MPANDDRLILDVQLTGGGSPGAGGPRESLPPINDITTQEIDRLLQTDAARRSPPPVIAPPLGGPGEENKQSTSLLQQIARMVGSNDVASLASGALTRATGSAALGSIGGGLAPTLAAAGPAAAIAAGAFAVGQINDTITEALAAGLRGLAGFATNPNPSDFVGGAANLARGATRSIDPLQTITGINLNPADDVLRGFISAIEGATRNLDQMAVSLSGVSGPVARELALSDVRQLRTRINRSQIVGDDLANFVNARSNAQAELEEIKTLLLREIIPIATAAVEGVGTIIGLANDSAKFLDDSGIKSGFITFLKTYPQTAVIVRPLAAIVQFLNEQAEARRKEENKVREEALEDFLDPAKVFDSGLPLPSGFPSFGPGAGGP